MGSPRHSSNRNPGCSFGQRYHQRLYPGGPRAGQFPGNARSADCGAAQPPGLPQRSRGTANGPRVCRGNCGVVDRGLGRGHPDWKRVEHLASMRFNYQLVLLLVSALALWGCVAEPQPVPAPPPDLKATVEAAVAATVAATAATALPHPATPHLLTQTATPGRTPEQVVTLTPMPTATPLATPTPLPTATPLPTSTPTPRLNPHRQLRRRQRPDPRYNPKTPPPSEPRPSPRRWGSKWTRLLQDSRTARCSLTNWYRR